MFKTKIKVDEEQGLTLTMSVKPDENGMIELGNNTIIHVDELKKSLEKHGISYIRFPNGDSQWNIGPGFSTENIKPPEDDNK